MTLPNTMPNALRSLADQIDDLEHARGHYKRISEELKAERDELQHQFEFLQNDFNQLYLEHRDGVPRIITADEVEVGMWVVWRHNGKWWAEVVEGDYSYSDIDGPCILLADAPPQESEPVTAEDPPKRLTVEDLDAAEVGSVLSWPHSKVVKQSDGTWEWGEPLDGRITSDWLIARGWGDPEYGEFTLTPPEPARRGRVVKPEELREDDRIDLHWTRGGCNLDRYVSRTEGTLVYLKRDDPNALEEAVSNAGVDEIRLISRKPPEPSEHPVIRAFCFYQAMPIEGGSPLLWEPIGEQYVGRYGPVSPEDIIDWSSAKVVSDA